MSNVLIVGDLHLNSSAPAARKDDSWKETVFEKVRQVYDIADENGVAGIVQLGDFFDVPNVHNGFICDVINLFRESPVDWYAIAGNHELRWGKKSELESSPLNILFESGVVQNLVDNDFSVGEFNVTAEHFLKDGTKFSTSDEEAFDVAVAHQYVVPPFGDEHPEVVPEKTIKEYDYFFFGHDHEKMDKVLGDTKVLNPGALVRTKSNERDRDVSVILFDSEERAYKFIDLDIKPAEEVYDESYLDGQQRKKSIDEYIESIGKDVEEDDFSELESKLEEISDNKEVVDTVKQYLREAELL